MVHFCNSYPETTRTSAEDFWWIQSTCSRQRVWFSLLIFYVFLAMSVARLDLWIDTVSYPREIESGRWFLCSRITLVKLTANRTKIKPVGGVVDVALAVDSVTGLHMSKIKGWLCFQSLKALRLPKQNFATFPCSVLAGGGAEHFHSRSALGV